MPAPRTAKKTKIHRGGLRRKEQRAEFRVRQIVPNPEPLRRENRTFQDLELEENLKKRDAETRCGLLVVDLRTFDAPHWLRFGGIVKELYDVGVLPGVIRPMAVGFKTDEVRRYLSFPEEQKE